MPPEDPTNTAPESQVSTGEATAQVETGGGAPIENEREFENSFASAAEQQPTQPANGKPATPAQPAAQQQQPAPRPAAPSITPEQWQQAQAEIARYRQMAAVGERYAAHAPDIDRYLAERQQQQRQEQEAAQQSQEFNRERWLKEQWAQPEITKEMQFALDNDLVQLDANGKYVAVPGYEAMVAPVLAGLNQFQAWHRETVSGLFKGNFPEKVLGFVEKPLMHAVEKLLEERFGQYQKQQRAASTIEQLERQLMPVLYATDQTTGAQTMTPEGQRLVSIVQKLEERFPDTPQDELLQMAVEFAGINLNQSAGNAAVGGASPHGSTAAPAPTPAPTPAQVSAEKKATFLEKATQRPAHGTQQSSYVPADAPLVSDQGDLDTFFTRQLEVASAS